MEVWLCRSLALGGKSARASNNWRAVWKKSKEFSVAAYFNYICSITCCFTIHAPREHGVKVASILCFKVLAFCTCQLSGIKFYYLAIECGAIFSIQSRAPGYSTKYMYRPHFVYRIFNHSSVYMQSCTLFPQLGGCHTMRCVPIPVHVL